MKKKGKKGLALAMTLAVTMTSVPTAFALDGNAQPTKQPDNQLGQRDTKAISYKYTKLDQAPMKESVRQALRIRRCNGVKARRWLI